jgi:hypothetical protein
MALVAGVVLTLFAFWFGFSWRPSLPPVFVAAPRRQHVPELQKPGVGVNGAARYFAELHPPPVAPKPPSIPKPPPPDVATLFRQNLEAIVPGPQVIVSDMSKGRRISRTLRIGDVYLQGWRLTSLTRRDAVLRRGRDERHVMFFAAAPLVLGVGGH